MLGHVLSLLDPVDVLRDRRIRANPIALHELDELGLVERNRRRRPPTSHLKAACLEIHALLKNGHNVVGPFGPGVHVKPVPLCNHEPIRRELLCTHHSPDCGLVPQGILGARGEKMADDELVDPRLVPLQVSRSRELGRVDGRVGLVVAIAFARPEKLAIVLEVPGVGPPDGVLPLLRDEGLEVKVSGVLLRFCPRVANPTLRVELLSDAHGLLRGEAKVSRGLQLQLHRGQGSWPHLSGLLAPAGHDLHLRICEAHVVECKANEAVEDPATRPVERRPSPPRRTGRVFPLHLQSELPELLGAEGINALGTLYDEAQGRELARAVRDHLGAGLVETVLEQASLEPRERCPRAEVNLHAGIHSIRITLVRSPQRFDRSQHVPRGHG
mmetsp:Transcript_24598/g.72118  ORF Transcript_24598/g.72118 Transcript_24598/m.72118 type:complete len:385 (+) Transcript_24598:36-1190(+)